MTSPRHCQPPRVKKSVSFCDSVTFAEEISVSGHAHNAWLSCSDAGTPLEASSFSDFARQASAVPPRLPEQQEAKMDSAENGGLNYSASASPKSPRGGGSGGGGGRNGFRRGSGGSIDGGLSLGKMGSISSSSDCGSGGNSSPTRMWDHWKLPRVNVPFYRRWTEATWHLLTATATPAAYAVLPYAMSRLTWYGGIPMLLLSIGTVYYCSMLTAELHAWRVIMRYTRYRDLAKSIWGMPGYHLAFIAQQLGSLGNNVAIQLSSALVMKNVYVSFHPGSDISIHIWLAIFAGFQLLLCQLPTLHHLRHLNAVATFATLLFAVITATGCFIDGSEPEQRRIVSYDLADGSRTKRVMEAFTGAGLMAFSLANVLLPEVTARISRQYYAHFDAAFSLRGGIGLRTAYKAAATTIQAVVKPPVALNGQKGVSLAFGFIAIVYPLVAIAGFWAFGNQVQSLVVLSLFPSRGWIAVMAQVLLVCHAAMNYQTFAQPSFEILEYLLMDTTDSLMSPKNCLSRLGGSTVYVLTLSFLAALLPNALSDVAAVVGATCYITLDIVFPLLMHISARRPGPLRRTAHIAGAAFWVCVAISAILGAIYDLANHAGGLQFFANIS